MTYHQATLPFSNLRNPLGIDVDRKRNTYVTDQGSDSVIALSATGEQTVAPLRGLSMPCGVKVTDEGSIYVADQGNDRVAVLDPDGNQTTLGFDGLNHPSGVDVAADGTVYVTDSNNSRVLALSPNGDQAELSFSFEEFAQPWGIVVDADNGVIVTVRHHGVEPIKKLSADGVETTLGFGKTGSPTDVDVDADGNVYITNFGADSFTDNIACLDCNGNASRVPFRERSVLRPIGIAVDHLGGITVLDWMGGGVPTRQGRHRSPLCIGNREHLASYPMTCPCTPETVSAACYNLAYDSTEERSEFKYGAGPVVRNTVCAAIIAIHSRQGSVATFRNTTWKSSTRQEHPRSDDILSAR